MTHALRSIHGRVREGRITGLIGPDASGKTTLMRLVAGLVRPDQGCVTVFGKDTIRDGGELRRLIGYMPQQFGLYADLTVSENLALYADLQGIPGGEREQTLSPLLEMGGLARFTSRLAGRLSGGMKQKLGLICTLLRTPRLLVLDEPTVGVDPVSRRELWAIIQRVSVEQGTTVLLSTAYLDEADHCAEIFVLRQGEVLASGEPGEFTARVRGRTFLASLPDAGDRRAAQAALSASDGVVDALLRGDHVRLVLENAGVVETLRDVAGPLEHVEPRFEDAFVDLLRGGRSDSVASAAHEPESSPPIEVMGSREILVVDGAVRDFGSFRAVDHATFSVAQGEVFGLLGANGAGKTTMFRMLCGLLKPTSGHLEVDGVNLRTAAARARARIGYMSQGFALYRELSVVGNLRFFGGAYGLRGRRLRTRTAWALDEFGLRETETDRCDRLSLGHKQRLAFACSLLHEPSVLFLDEPTSGVDPIARREFWRRINVIAGSGVTVLVTTHFMEEAEYCDRLAIMVDGRIIALGAPAEIKRKAGRDPDAGSSMEDAFLSLVSSTPKRAG